MLQRSLGRPCAALLRKVASSLSKFNGKDDQVGGE